MTHPSQELDDLVHQRVRLGILAVLYEVDRAAFGHLKTMLELTDGNLARHLQVLEEAGLVAIHKEFRNRKPKTWVQLTRDGRAAYAEEIDILRDIVRRYGRPR